LFIVNNPALLKPFTGGNVSIAVNHNGGRGSIAQEVSKAMITTVNIIWIKLRQIKSKIIFALV
jgi:hypothetical protein